ncbi:SH3 domain-containing protein [Streptomyces sp. NPDC058751]|uniref:SH3 domain-containing protein n=1 Tax=Streptomyces sp. NPDC058751 TaxID=3346623 RepID=UPI0036CE47FE
MALAIGGLALSGTVPALADDGGGTGSTGSHQWNAGGDGDGGGRDQGTGGDGGGTSWNNGGGGTGDNGGGGGNTWNGGGGNQNWNNGGGGGGDGREPANSNANNNGNGNGNSHGQNGQQLSQGRVTARGGLALRSAPTRGSQLIRVARQGEIVSIFCKTPGETVDGNPLWYLLADGTWAWGAARYIDSIGPAPRWC